MLQAKKSLLYLILSVLLTLGGIASFNFYMDPLWTFEHSHKYNQFQRARKERQQKSNALYFRSKKYDTLLFGSSRITYMNQNDWGETTFNYAVSDMQPREYKAYLDFAIDKAKQPIKRVIIGLDFFGALEYEPLISKNPSLILNEITKPLYRYKLLLSLDSLDYSFKNLKYYMKKKTSTYNYNNIKTSPKKKETTKEKFHAKIQKDITIYKRNRYSKSYDKNYKYYIQELKNSYPQIEFVVFTTPTTAQHFKAVIESSHYDDYNRWLKESVEVFSTVHHFFYLSTLAQNAHLYFKDSNHAYASTYRCLVNEILQKDSLCPKTDIILRKESIVQQLKLLETINTK